MQCECRYGLSTGRQTNSGLHNITTTCSHGKYGIKRSVHVATQYQELMSHPKGGEGAFNYVVMALSKVLAVL